MITWSNVEKLTKTLQEQMLAAGDVPDVGVAVLNDDRIDPDVAVEIAKVGAHNIAEALTRLEDEADAEGVEIDYADGFHIVYSALLAAFQLGWYLAHDSYATEVSA